MISDTLLRSRLSQRTRRIRNSPGSTITTETSVKPVVYSDDDDYTVDLEQSASSDLSKRLGSLSIVNPVDVLRERVLLELARRKMRQNQKQVDANRRFLQTIGKRAISDSVESHFDDDDDDHDEDDFAKSDTPKMTKVFSPARVMPESVFHFENWPNQQQQQQQWEEPKFSDSEWGTDEKYVWNNRGENLILE